MFTKQIYSVTMCREIKYIRGEIMSTHNNAKRMREPEKNYSKNNKEDKPKKKRKGLKIFLIVLIIIVVIIAAILAAGYTFIASKLGEMNQEEIDINAISIDDAVADELSDYRNIALFGIDSRADDYGRGNRSDCIIIASINKKTSEVKLVSVYRDTYLKLTGRNLDKVTHAYSYGGAELAVSTLNANLDLNIQEYVTVNFDAVVDAVDALGGIRIEVDSEEIKYINKYIDENNRVTEHNSSHINTAGTYNLDGVQALAYSRIRYTAGGDFKRTERMREVLEAMVNKAKTLSMSQLLNVVNIMLPKISTNMSSNDIIGLAPTLLSMKIEESDGWPKENKGSMIGGVYYGVPINLEANVKSLHEELFGQTDYTPSETVQEISDEIINKTGIQ